MLSRRILLVEDNPDHEMLALLALKRNNLGEDVTVVRDGAEALDYLLSPDQHEADAADRLPLVTLLDLKLPGIDGLEVLRRLRQDKRTRYLPVVVLTSSDEQGDIRASYSLGANSYVCKPVDFKQFVEAIRQLSVYWLGLNEVPDGR